MAEGRESVAYALPFCAGTVTGNFVCGVLAPTSYVFYTVVSLSLAAVVAACLILVRNTSSAESRPWRKIFPEIAALTFATGFFCSLSHFLASSVISPGGALAGASDLLTGAAEDSATMLKKAIDAIPFREKDSNALAKALLTGDRSGLSPEIRGYFTDSGAAHLLALSGMHLGIIYAVIAKPLKLAGKSSPANIIRYATTVSAAFFYTRMTGASPSIVRAFLFILINETAAITGRKRNIVPVLCAALTLQCTFDPGVVSSVSFQLSYLAMAGIAFIFPHIRDWFPTAKGWSVIPKKIWDAAAMAISCQLTTGPLAWIKFGSMPVYFIITNLIAVPLTTAAIPIVIACVAFQSIGIDTGILIEAGNFFLENIIFSLRTISSLS